VRSPAPDALPSEAEIIDLERRRLAALVARDMATADALHADDYELVTPGGRTMTKAEYLGGVERRELAYVVFEAASHERVRLGDGMAVVRYGARIEIDWEGGHDEGTFWHTDVWELRSSGWQAVWSHATRIRE
jgi:ketosteroid isomerase-like protein